MKITMDELILKIYSNVILNKISRVEADRIAYALTHNSSKSEEVKHYILKN